MSNTEKHDGHDHDDHGSDHGRDAGHDDQRGHAGHSHRHGPPSSQGKLFWALLLTGGCMVIEALGGWLSGSLALLADAAHMLTDCASLAMGYAAVRAASRPVTTAMTYGHHRWQVLAAFVNGLALMLLAVWIAVEAAQRLSGGNIVQGGVVAGVALIGMLVNVAAFAVLSRGESNLNVRSALAHVIGDLLGSFGALIAGGIIYFTAWMPADPILSAVVALIMVRSGWRIARESAHILLEGAPNSITAGSVEQALVTALPEIVGVHHLHVWSLTDEQPVMTLHAVLREGADRDRALADIQNVLRERFSIEHATVQIETATCADVACAPGAMDAHGGHHPG